MVNTNVAKQVRWLRIYTFQLRRLTKSTVDYTVLRNLSLVTFWEGGVGEGGGGGGGGI
jgi:hypothetical protein